jgi:hypothetical protein
MALSRSWLGAGTSVPRRPELVHQGCLYGSDDEFLAMATPFITAGLARGEAVLAATTQANLELLGNALGDAARGLDFAETAYFGRRPPQRVAAFDRYLKTHLRSPGQVRVIAEPIWIGRSERDIRAWKQMEASLNLIFAHTRMWMICPYDTRVLRDDIVADARRTHPSCVAGQETVPSTSHADPEEFTSGLDDGPLPRPPADAAELTFTGDLAVLRHFVANAAAARGLAGDKTALFVVAAAEAASYVRQYERAAVTVWDRPGAVVCDITQPAGGLADLRPGWRPPELERPRPDDGLWLARQVCEQVETRSAHGRCTIRLHMPSPHALTD